MATATRSKKAKQLKQLAAKRGNLLQSAQLIREFDQNYDVSQAAEIPFRLDRLDKLWDELEHVDMELEALCGEDPGAIETRAEFQNLYYRLKGSLTRKLPAPTQANPPAPVQQQQIMLPSSGVRLPELKIPEFDGNPEDWSGFHDLFKSMIHDNYQLTNIQKLHYLRASLKGDAARIISSLAVSTYSYTVAWKLITDRYEDKNLLIKQHISALFSVSPLRNESASGLSELADEFEKHVKILDSLETKAQHWDSVLVELLFSRMDATSQKQWENNRDKTQRPSYDDLIKFIHDHSRTLQSLKLSQLVCTPSMEAKLTKSRQVLAHSATEQTPKCTACKQAHFLFQCEVFRDQTPHQRFDLVKRNNLCINCIKASHQARNCTSGCCKYCQKKHHTLLHLPSSASLMTGGAPPHSQQTEFPMHETNPNLSHSPPVPFNSGPDVTSVNRAYPLSSPSVFAPRLPPSEIVTPPFTACQTVAPANVGENTVILYTSLVNIHDNLGHSQIARALLDSGSQSSFVSESLCQRLSLNRVKINMPVSGIGQAIVNVRYVVSVSISSRFGSQQFPLHCLVLPKLTVNLPTKTVDINTWKIPKHLPLADPHFYQSHGIDLIIGAELIPFILQSEQIPFDDQLPPLQKTSFGYVFSGKVPASMTTPLTCLVSAFDNLDAQVKRFWEVENFDVGKCLTAEEQQCEAHFASTHSRNADGRYVVRLPVRQELLPSIGDTWNTAARRFSALERRFRSDETLYKSYTDFMEEYERLGHMEEVKTRVALPQYFLPHHAVHRPDSSTTKIRVVFDGSAKSSNQLSLNDLLLTGPTVQPSMLCIVVNSRFHRFVMKADVEKMFRQALVHPDDRLLQQVAWRRNESEPLKTYSLNTVTYGTSCAPYLATRVLNQLADDEGHDFPLAAPIVKKDFYVDDVLTGSESIEALVKTSIQLTELLKRDGFNLRKWSANHPSILEHFPEELKEHQLPLELDRSASIKALGLLWFPKEDVFGFKVPDFPALPHVTKRLVLSEMSQLFDPLGLVGPVVASAKMFVQRLWQEKLSWDEKLPDILQSWWLSFRAAIGIVRNLRVPRWVFEESAKSYELHCFVDASSKGYGACIYTVSTGPSTKRTSHLLIAKSRVAPVCGYSIPRLELCAAVLGSQLADTIRRTTKFDSTVTFWSDSSIVLHWINSPPSSWKIFVSNRVSEVQKLTQGSQWWHVPTLENPADRISRGVQPDDIKNDALWWHGPSYLLNEVESWPAPIIPLTSTDIQQQTPEQRQTVVLLSVTFDDSLIHDYSQLSHLIKVASFCQRFAKNCRLPRMARTVGPITLVEYDSTLKSLIRVTQAACFQQELRHLRHNDQERMALRKADFKSPLKDLDVWIDDTGLLRLNGRLANSPGSFDSRLPIILPADHHLSRLIANSVHHQTLHAGPTQLLATIRQRFWPIRGRDLARRTVHHCVTCFRFHPPASNQFMAPLPSSRVTAAKVFEHTGLDYCGPFFVRPLAGRGASVKVWVTVYVCFAVKAVVLDIVAGLSTESCVNSLRRFASRVGRVRTIHCDNSTTFVGARREVMEMRQALKGIEFQFIPPRAPHYGGLWEAAVKAFKRHFWKIIGAAPHHYDDMRTVVSQAECILNSRPLTPLSNDPQDLSVLTPGHFLLGESPFHLPEADLSQVPTNRLNHFQATQRSVQNLWKRWSTEYIGLLHQRPAKWRKSPTEFRVGTMVLVKKDNVPSMQWPLGRVVAIYPGSDNIVRVVDVRTQLGIRRRATSELCVLPIEDQGPTKAHDCETVTTNSS
ncbi:uncharacterized protein LOC135715141 [Ochlerotatus camptorhynchus]|uniref:uncharacterized protein LOC135715141 n=1 Tax=Ochlerotatus camptorhynchus TaxID=644619 RepID=UPI0031E323B9